MAYSQRGYSRLAALMRKEKNVAIFRRFEELNILCLLSLQAEIVQLEKEFRIECVADDSSRSPPASEYSSNFKLSRDEASTQHTKLKAIRDLIREYNEILIQMSELSQVDKPMKSQLKSLKSWLDDSEGGNSFLTNYETATWEDDDLHSYVCLEPPSAKGDPFTKWLLNSAVRAFDRVLGRYIGCGVVVDDQTGDRSYSSDGVNRASNIIAAAVASALPVLAIYVLNGISSVERRIGATAGFTVAFAVLMGYFSSATRAEMIAATATFAAIEVVFIGTAISAGSAGDQSTNVSINGTLCSNGTTVG